MLFQDERRAKVHFALIALAVQLAALFFSVQLLLSSYANTTESSLHRRAKHLRDRRIAQGTSRTE